MVTIAMKQGKDKVMDKYVVSWTEEIWQRVVIEAESGDHARELFLSGEFDTDTVKVTGSDIEVDCVVRKVKE